MTTDSSIVSGPQLRAFAICRHTARRLRVQRVRLRYRGAMRLPTCPADITDHFTEDNKTVQDHISIRPTHFVLKNYIGELVDQQGGSSVHRPNSKPGPKADNGFELSPDPHGRSGAGQGHPRQQQCLERHIVPQRQSGYRLLGLGKEPPCHADKAAASLCVPESDDGPEDPFQPSDTFRIHHQHGD